MIRRTALLAMALAALALVPTSGQAQAPELDGAWELEFGAPWGMVLWKFDLQQEGTTLEGISKQGMGTLVLRGAVDRGAIEFQIDLVDGPHDLSIAFTGRIEGKKVGGSVEFNDGTKNEWTLTPTKQD